MAAAPAARSHSAWSRGARHTDTLRPMASDQATDAPRRRLALTVTATVAVIAICWILGNPRSSGPDEPSHMVTSAGLVRGELTGDPNPADPATHLMTVPAMVGAPDPGCWAFVASETPACASGVPLSTDEVPAATTSYNYPPFGLVLPGVASLVSWPAGYAYLARALGALLPVFLLGGAITALADRHRSLAVAALAGLTPIAWFTLGVVNPSGLAISGGLALAAGCLLLPTARPRAELIATVAWIALTLARRDGPLWAAAVVIAVCITIDVRPSDLWRHLSRRSRVVIAVSAALPPIQVIARGDTFLNVALAGAVLGILVYEWLLDVWAKCTTVAARRRLLAALVAAAAAGFVAVLVMRPGGYDANVVRLVIGNTGDHLVQLVGVLGWLNAPVPTTAVLAFWATVGGLAAVALIERPRSALAGTATLAAVVVLAWLLEFGHGASYGEYWQGRYSMPLAVAVPLLLAWREHATSLDRLVGPLAMVWWGVANLGFFASQRRWAVGVDGSWYFWRWDVWGAPVPPALLLVVHAGATAWLARTLVRSEASRP